MTGKGTAQEDLERQGEPTPPGEAVDRSATRRSVQKPTREGAPKVEPPPGRASLPAGTLLQDYRIEEEIGRGGVGAVYRATHVTLGRSFAIKVVGIGGAVDADSAKRLVREARTASTIDNDHIVDVTHLGIEGEGLVFVVMELLRGEDLRQRLNRQSAKGQSRWLPDEEVLGIVPQVLSAIRAAHAAGIVHRDLKPGNIFLARRGDREVVKVVDFGLSKLSAVEGSMRLTKTGQIIGTPLYMAPEQSRDGAAVDERSDIYSLGIILYELLGGEVPFPETTIYECIFAHASKEPPPLAEVRPDLPAGVVEVVHRCLEKDPEARFADVDELEAAWELAWAGSVSAHTEGERERLPSAARSGSRRAPPAEAPATPGGAPRRAAWAAAAFVAAAVGIAAWVGTRGGEEGEAVAATPAGGVAPAGAGATGTGDGAGTGTTRSGTGAGTEVRAGAGTETRAATGTATGSAAAAGAETETGAGPSPDGTETLAGTQPGAGTTADGAGAGTGAGGELRTVTITSSPAGAEVLDGDESLGSTPVQFEIVPGAPARELTVRAAGHRPRRITIDGDAPDIVEAELTRLPRRRATRPSAPPLAEY